jgi:hypothetical protein
MATAFLGTQSVQSYDVAEVPGLVRLVSEQHCLLVLEYGYKVVGMLAAVKSPNLLSPTNWIWQELVWWVEPEYRRLNLGGELLVGFLEVVGETPALVTTLPHTAIERSWMESRGWELKYHCYGVN